MVASRAYRVIPDSALQAPLYRPRTHAVRAPRARDHGPLARNILITGLALAALTFGSAGVALFGGDSFAAPSPFMASRGALKIALVDPAAAPALRRDPALPIETPAPRFSAAARSEPKIEAPQTRPAEPRAAKADKAVPLPAARPAMPAFLPLPQPRDAGADITGSLGEFAPRLVKIVSFVPPQPRLATRPARALTPHEKLYGPVRVAALTPAATQHDVGAALPRAPYDLQTAVYVIGDRKVYLPDGRALEAHSGLGDKMDDPRFVHLRMRGATPPHIYDMKMRESLFHGVEAIRLTPVGGEQAIFNRDGLLAHSYLLGPNGQSNGCVSFKDYGAFLSAFKAGHITRLAVIARLD